MSDTQNPIRFRQAAFAARELMEELDKAAGVVPGPGLKNRVEALREHWNAAESPAPDGEGDDPLAGFSGRLDDFFAAYDAEYPDRVERARATIRELDPAKRDSPPAVETPRAEAWVKFRRDFNTLLHRSRSTDGEFESRLGGFEDFLLDWFRPRTFDDFDELDSLIDEGPPNG